MAKPSITDEQLIAYAAGDLAGEDALAVERQLAGDPAARRSVAMYRLAAARRGADDSVAPPRQTVEKARAIYDRAAPSLADVAVMIARLVFDSRVQPAAVRVGHCADRFQLSFTTDEGDLDVQAERLETTGAGVRWRLMGQYATDAETTDLEVALFRAGQSDPVAVARADEHAVFTLESEPGDYEMRLSRPGAAEIVVPGLGIR